MPQICDMGPMALLSLRRKACWGLFSPWKAWQLWPCLNPRTWVLKGSMLPLDHRSRFYWYFNTVGVNYRVLWSIIIWIAFSGAVAVCATACNLLHQHTPIEEIQRRHLMDDWDGIETFSVVGGGLRGVDTPLESIPPPPPYSPWSSAAVDVPPSVDWWQATCDIMSLFR